MQEMEFEIRRFSKDNFHEFYWLFQQVFGGRKALAFLKQKYNSFVPGVDYLGYIAYSNNSPVAFMGALPHYCTFNGKTELAAQLVDAMTLPEYQRSGLFTLLGKEIGVLAEASGIRFLWAFGGQTSGTLVRKYLDFQQANEMIGFQWDGTDLPLRRYRNKLGGIFAETSRTKKILKPWIIDGSFISSLDATFGPIVCRDEQYMSHKFATGSFFIDINGAQFWVKVNNGIRIGDMNAPSEEILDNGLKKLVSLAKKKRLGNVMFQSSPDTFPARVAAKSANKAFPSWQLVYRNLNSDFPLEKLNATLADIDTF